MTIKTTPDIDVHVGEVLWVRVRSRWRKAIVRKVNPVTAWVSLVRPIGSHRAGCTCRACAAWVQVTRVSVVMRREQPAGELGAEWRV